MGYRRCPHCGDSNTWDYGFGLECGGCGCRFSYSDDEYEIDDEDELDDEYEIDDEIFDDI